MADFERALDETRASVTPEMEQEYEKIQDKPEAGRDERGAAASASSRRACSRRGGRRGRMRPSFHPKRQRTGRGCEASIQWRGRWLSRYGTQSLPDSMDAMINV